MTDLPTLAEQLDGAAMDATAMSQLSKSHEVSVDDAYEIQRLSIERRIARGEQLVGVKLGFTSRAKMIQMGVDDLFQTRQKVEIFAPDPALKLHPRLVVAAIQHLCREIGVIQKDIADLFQKRFEFIP